MRGRGRRFLFFRFSEFLLERGDGGFLFKAIVSQASC